MRTNRWTLGLITAGIISSGSADRAEESPSPIMTALSSTMISGYVDTSAQWNLGTGNANAPNYIFGGPSKADGFNLNVVKLVIEKPPTPSDDWGAGYKVDLLFGPDAITYGTSAAIDSAAIKQAYVEVKAPLANGIDVKMGVWDTILGYEVFETPLNPTFTRSYGYTIEPATFTGILASYPITELIGVAAGVANAENSVINAKAQPLRPESYKTYLGDVSLTAPPSWKWLSGSTFFAAVVNGFNPIAAGVGGKPADQTSFYTGMSITTPLKTLKFGLAYDYAGVQKQALSQSGYANATSLYVAYQAAEKLSFNERAEWFTQSKGNGVPGLPSKVFALTSTVQYDLWANVLSRLEFRWDHSADGTLAYGGILPGAAPTRKNSIEIIGNIIYKF